jgi:hypothetical protein
MKDEKGPLYAPQDVQHRRKLASAIIRTLQAAGFRRLNNADPTKEQVWVRPLYKTVAEDTRVKKTVKTRFRIKVCTSVITETTDDRRPMQTVIMREKDADTIYVLLTYLRIDHDQEEERYREVVLERFKVLRAGFLSGIPDRILQRARQAHELHRTAARCCWCKTAPLAKSAKSGKEYCADMCWKTKGPRDV